MPVSKLSSSPTESLETTLERLLEPALADRGVELVELRVSGNERRYVLRVFVDRPDGISIGECAQLSRDLANVLDTYDPIESSYVLEVSSPGLTRPLTKVRDFERALGKDIRLILRSGAALNGNLKRVEGGALVVQVEGEILDISIDEVTKANLDFKI